jgi:hypothetical protein
LKLVFHHLNALGEFSFVLPILFGFPPGRPSAHQSYNRKSEDDPNETQREKDAENFHRMTPQELPRMLAPKPKANNDG